MKTAVYTGSFDPITLGHLDVIQRSSRLVEKLVVGIGVNIEKQGLFSTRERIDLVKRCTRDLDNVEVRSFEGLAVNFVTDCGANVMIRGVRPLTDVAAEITMTMANRQLNDHLETVFLMADVSLQPIASKLVKEIAIYGGDIARFVSPPVRDEVEARVREIGTKGDY